MQTIFIAEILPPDGFAFPVENPSSALKCFPIIGTGSGTTNSKLTLFPNSIKFKVVLTREKLLSTIESIDVELHVFSITKFGRSQNVIIFFKDSILAYRANIREREDLIELLRFFQQKSLPFTNNALDLIENRKIQY